MGSQLDCGEASARETCTELATHPVPNDECDGAFEGLFHLALAVVALGRGRLDTRRLEKWLTSGCGECVDAVDLDGHWLDMAVSVDDGDNERASLLLVHCFGELGFSGTSDKSTRPTLSHEFRHVRYSVRWSVRASTGLIENPFLPMCAPSLLHLHSDSGTLRLVRQPGL